MSLENFRVPETPETRTPRVLALLLVIGLVSSALRWLIGFEYAVELTLLLAAAAVSYVVWRFIRVQPASRNR